MQNLAADLTWAADRLEATNPDRDADFSAGVDWAVAELRRLAAEAHQGPGHPPSLLPDWAIIQLSDRGIDPGDVSHFIGDPTGPKLAAAVDGKPIHLTRD